MKVLGLDALLNRMRMAGVTRCVGRVQAFHKPLAFAFLADTFDLLLSAVGQEMPLFLNRHVEQRNGSFTIHGFLGDDYNRWKEYFGLGSSGNKKFSLEAVLEKIGSQIASLDLSETPNYTDLLKMSSYQSDGEGIYFVGLRHNPSPTTTSEKNYEKTCIAFGKEVADRLRLHNISTRWSPFPGDESKRSISSHMSEISFF